VVTLVVEHAINRPAESLMVVTASTRHAEISPLGKEEEVGGGVDGWTSSPCLSPSANPFLPRAPLRAEHTSPPPSPPPPSSPPSKSGSDVIFPHTPRSLRSDAASVEAAAASPLFRRVVSRSARPDAARAATRIAYQNPSRSLGLLRQPAALQPLEDEVTQHVIIPPLDDPEPGVGPIVRALEAAAEAAQRASILAQQRAATVGIVAARSERYPHVRTAVATVTPSSVPASSPLASAAVAAAEVSVLAMELDATTRRLYAAEEENTRMRAALRAVGAFHLHDDTASDGSAGHGSQRHSPSRTTPPLPPGSADMLSPSTTRPIPRPPPLPTHLTPTSPTQ
jgi:hypothetical protein